MTRSRASAWRAIVVVATAIALFAFNWVLRYNDPEGSYLGLTDDHFYYVIRGWQMLFGELPDRDYIDAGAPLAYAISAALQLTLGRGTWSEYVFCVTMLSLGTAVVTVVAARGTGSVLVGLLAGVFTIAFAPRLYGYPKVLVYACAIAALWWWIAAPRAARTVVLSVVTATGFLLRHDHGVFVAMAFILLLAGATHLPWRERARHAAIYAAATLLLLAPYLGYLQQNGGIVRHFVTGYEWAQREGDRAPFALPTFSSQPLFGADTSDAPRSQWWKHAPFTGMGDYQTWWMFWLAELLPFIALAQLISRARAGPQYRDERLRIGVVIVLALLVNLGFLRGNLPTQLPDVVVPMAVLGAWCLASVVAAARDSRHAAARSSVTVALRTAVAAAALLIAGATALLLMPSMRGQVENTSLLKGIGAIRGDAEGVTERLKGGWPIDSWAADDRRGPIRLAYYLKRCTATTDRVLVAPYIPQVVGLAERGFAGGQGDLRPGFSATAAEQELTIARLRRQSVPVVFGPGPEDRGDFDRWLPIVARYLATEYVNLGDRDLGEGLVVSVMVSRHARSTHTFEPLGLPCFQ